MNVIHFKRTLLALIVSLLLFTVCFTAHIAALSPSQPEDSTESVTSVIASIDDPVSSTSSEDVISSEVPSNASSDAADSDFTSFESSLVSSDVSSEIVPSDLSSLSSSLPESSTPSISAPVSSEGVSSLVVEAVSEGTVAPDDMDEQYYDNGSYVYHGSYSGLSSNVSSESTEKDKTTEPGRSATAQRYANYATWGMIIFGIISLAMIALLVYFNMKVRESKKLHPEWYPKKEKSEKIKPSHKAKH